MFPKKFSHTLNHSSTNSGEFYDEASCNKFPLENSILSQKYTDYSFGNILLIEENKSNQQVHNELAKFSAKNNSQTPLSGAKTGTLDNDSTDKNSTSHTEKKLKKGFDPFAVQKKMDIYDEEPSVSGQGNRDPNQQGNRDPNLFDGNYVKKDNEKGSNQYKYLYASTIKMFFKAIGEEFPQKLFDDQKKKNSNEVAHEGKEDTRYISTKKIKKYLYERKEELDFKFLQFIVDLDINEMKRFSKCTISSAEAIMKNKVKIVDTLIGKRCELSPLLKPLYIQINNEPPMEFKDINSTLRNPQGIQNIHYQAPNTQGKRAVNSNFNQAQSQNHCAPNQEYEENWGSASGINDIYLSFWGLSMNEGGQNKRNFGEELAEDFYRNHANFFENKHDEEIFENGLNETERDEDDQNEDCSFF